MHRKIDRIEMSSHFHKQRHRKYLTENYLKTSPCRTCLNWRRHRGLPPQHDLAESKPAPCQLLMIKQSCGELSRRQLLDKVLLTLTSPMLIVTDWWWFLMSELIRIGNPYSLIQSHWLHWLKTRTYLLITKLFHWNLNTLLQCFNWRCSRLKAEVWLVIDECEAGGEGCVVTMETLKQQSVTSVPSSGVGGWTRPSQQLPASVRVITTTTMSFSPFTLLRYHQNISDHGCILENLFILNLF